MASFAGLVTAALAAVERPEGYRLLLHSNDIEG